MEMLTKRMRHKFFVRWLLKALQDDTIDSVQNNCNTRNYVEFDTQYSEEGEENSREHLDKTRVDPHSTIDLASCTIYVLVMEGSR